MGDDTQLKQTEKKPVTPTAPAPQPVSQPALTPAGFPVHQMSTKVDEVRALPDGKILVPLSSLMSKPQARPIDEKQPFKWLAYILLILLFTGFGAFAFASVSPLKTEQQTIYLHARQFDFEPNRIVVEKGTPVKLIITTEDVAHGFYLDGFATNEHIYPGEEKVIEFVADKSGKFSYRCSLTCGSYHPYMKGEMVVVDKSINLGYLAFILTAVGLAAFIIYYIYRKESVDTYGLVKQAVSNA